MKRPSLFFMSLAIAIMIAYLKRPSDSLMAVKQEEKWKTFEKKSEDKILAHNSTDKELAKGNIVRKVASVVNPQTKLFTLREERVLTGENIEKYKDESVELSMVNKISPDWKETLGKDLLKFQAEDTKIIIKDELQLIKIQDDKGQYLEQVVITFLLKNGDQNSFRALINSETGAVIDTWDRTIHERFRRRPSKLIPSAPSNIVGK
jgi:hypothetical protein